LDGLNTFISSNIGLVSIVLSVVIVVLLALILLTLRRAARLDHRLAELTRGSDGNSLEAVLDAHLDKVYAVARDLDGLAARTASLEWAQPQAFQRIGLVRFNPFEDTGGNQSFAIALLDARGDGFVISSLHARSGTRVYGKSVSGGTSESTLSTEEAQAVKLALASRPVSDRAT
jgi:Protein of unknown function (DUF4446)